MTRLTSVKRKLHSADPRDLDEYKQKPHGGSFVLDRIGQCVTMVPRLGEGPLGIIRDAAIAVMEGKIAWIGERSELPREYRRGKFENADHALVTPGLIDCHTHLIFSGSRSDEFYERLNGTSYEKIAERGGGILKTVRMTAKTSDRSLVFKTERRLKKFLRYGVTTVEIKSGYGLETERELRLLRLLKKIQTPVDTIPTFLGAHAIPTEYKSNRKKFVKEVCNEMLPAVVESKLASICDVFCDPAAFTVEESRAILKAAYQLGMQTKVHADQLAPFGGAELAAEFKSLSADHLEHVSDAGIRGLAKAGTVGVLLPGAVFFTNKKQYPNARKLIDGGVRVAISTDCNPGSCNSENLPLMMTFAAVELKMTLAEIWAAVTTHAARACGLSDRGDLQPFRTADLVVWSAKSAADIPYQFGSARARIVFKNGVKVLG
jgi:imidazolonepropionase